MYIRTKDGVYELVDNLYQYHNGVEKFWYAKEENGKTLAIEITADKILNQSENLDELCDEFVIHRKEHNYNFVWNEDRNIGLNYFCFLPEKYDVYGAVWVDGKGLIYVAKMNDEGKLVLI